MTLDTAAQGWVGTPFQWCAAERGKGCDCAGLIVGCLHECGFTDWRPPAYGREFDTRILLAPLSRFCVRVWHDPLPARNPSVILRAGDILLFAVRKRPYHLAIATGHRSMIHTYQSVGRVVETELTPLPWRLMSVYRWRGGNV